jgi:pilus assembly protein CpaF
VNAIIPPLSLCGPVVTIRKFALRPLSPADLVDLGTLSEPVVEFLGACVRARVNLLVSGGTGSGKTSLLGALSSFIPAGERLITIEDAAELRLTQPHVVSLEARPPNVEGVGEVTVRSLVRNALRMRPDRIIVGEVRGGEALDMLQAMNTGHEGSMSTAHANSPQDLISRLETLSLMSDVELPVQHVREQIASALDLVVHMSRLPDGRRTTTRISAVEGMRRGAVAMEDIFVWRRDGGGGLRPTGSSTPLLTMLAERDERVDPRVFRSTPEARPHRPAVATAPSIVPGSPGVTRAPTLHRSLDASGTPSSWPGALRRLGSVIE